MKMKQLGMMVKKLTLDKNGLKFGDRVVIKLHKRSIQGMIVAVFAGLIVFVAVPNKTTEISTTPIVRQTAADMLQVLPVNVVAVPKEKADIQIVSATNEITPVGESVPDQDEEIVAEEIVADFEKEAEICETSPWDNRLMPNVEESLNIRTEASEDAEVAGRLYSGSVAEIQEKGEVWTKISSGNVEGYVKNEFCVFGAEAEAMAQAQCPTYATATSGGVRVRAEADSSEETEIVYVLEEGEKISVDKEAEAPEGWVVVIYNDEAAFVSEELVSVEQEWGKAISIEEEEAAIREAEEQAAAEAEQEQGESQSQTPPPVSQREAVTASYDDVTLLGALIQCEAGSECYEGKVAVGAVVMNRLRCGYAGSIYDVIYQSGQFWPASSGALADVLASGVSGSCLQAAQEAIGGVDNVGGATNFRNVSCGRSGIVIGNHVFW